MRSEDAKRERGSKGREETKRRKERWDRMEEYATVGVKEGQCIWRAGVGRNKGKERGGWG